MSGRDIPPQRAQVSSLIDKRSRDVLYITGVGDDTVDGGPVNDWMQMGGGNDTARGGSGNDNLLGGQGDDMLFGGDGNDILDGDRMWGNLQYGVSTEDRDLDQRSRQNALARGKRDRTLRLGRMPCSPQ